MTSMVEMLAMGLACPDCPTQSAAREIFFTQDLWVRLTGTLGPLVVTAAAVALFVTKLRRYGLGRDARRVGGGA
jgi:heme A synthase